MTQTCNLLQVSLVIDTVGKRSQKENFAREILVLNVVYF